jgi:hypothetical protein
MTMKLTHAKAIEAFSIAYLTKLGNYPTGGGTIVFFKEAKTSSKRSANLDIQVKN